MCFEDQVRLFRDAKVIVGASGAAFTNLLFCCQNPDVLALIASHNVDFPLFANLLRVAGTGRYTHVPGRPAVVPEAVPNEDQYVHVNFTTKIEDILGALKLMQRTRHAISLGGSTEICAQVSF